ncbi:BCCT family transporter [Megasphaera elsdenii]|uniref:BCCT family transporter n=1 Tax=Megasphaera elsdenii TaxID=907 RepID=UPI00273AC58E|nr:BCCT family transporter [Megasphaera elsdenii]
MGNEDEKPEFSFFSWLCMLFSAGMGNSSNRPSTRLSRTVCQDAGSRQTRLIPDG